MTQTFSENVVIQGSQDTLQLKVQGVDGQTQPLQTWMDHAGTPLVQVTEDGRIQVGDPNLGTADALIEANVDRATTANPARGIQSLGRFTGALSALIAWVVHELELLGTGGVTGLQTALRARVTHSNTGDSSNAELRAGDFQAINQTGTSGTPVGQVTGVCGTASNSPSGSTAYLAKAVGVEATVTNDTGGNIAEAVAVEVVAPTNDGTISTLYGLHVPDLTQGEVNYALHTGQGPVHFGDHQELKVLTAAPSDTPPEGFIKLYPRFVEDVPKLYAKDAQANEYELGGSGGVVYHPKRATMMHHQALVLTGGALTRTLTTSLWYGFYAFQTAFANGDSWTNSFMAAAGSYTLSLYGIANVNGGKIDIYIDDVLALAGVDWYASSAAYGTTRSGTITIATDGYHVLKAVVNGKNGSSVGYCVPLTLYWIAPAAD